MRYYALLFLICLLPKPSLAQVDTLYKGAFFDNWPDSHKCYRVITKQNDLWQKQDIYSENQQLKLSVTYLDSFFKIKSGFFTRHLFNGILVDSLHFENNILTEAWYFHDNGNRSAYEAYENSKMVVNLNWDENDKEIDKDYKEIVYKNKYPSWSDYLKISIEQNQPKAYTNGKIHGAVSVLYTVGKDGYVVKARIYRTSGYSELDEHALNILKNSPRFSPIRKHGRKVEAQGVATIEYPSMNPLDD